MNRELNGKLSQAIRNGDALTVKNILNQNPEIIGVDWGDGFTWLHKAAEFNNADVVAEFVSAGIDINAKLYNKPQTPLHLAVLKQCENVVRWLVKNGAELDVGGGDYPVPLSYAASGNLEIVKLLVSNGANVNTCHDYPPSNPLSLAKKWNKPEIESYLRDHGALYPWETEAFLKIRTAASESVAHFKKYFENLRPYSELRVDSPVQIWISEATPERDYVCFFTCGLSGESMPGEEGIFPERIEMIFELPGNWPVTDELLFKQGYHWPIDWLLLACKRVITDRVLVYEGHTLSDDSEQPIGPQTEMTNFLILKELRPFGVFSSSGRTGGRIQVLSLFPIHTREREYLEQFGLVALIKKFQEKRISPKIELSRQSVV